MNNIYLTGLPGSGKTTLGLRLAQSLSREFVDLDACICRETGRSIPQIFSGYGEGFFRAVEATLLRELSKREGCVISTGGGTILRKANVEAMKSTGLVIFIDRCVEDIARDIEIKGRPLLAEGLERLHALAAQRREAYPDAADIILRNDCAQGSMVRRLRAACEAAEAGGYAVIGSPIAHSLSPRIHEALFGARHLREEYAAIHVPRGCLEAFVEGCRVSGLRGCNVTLPHKRDIIPLLDEVDDEAALCASVNTVVRRDGRLVGHNTDMDGLLLALRDAGQEYRGREVLLLGTGGAANGVAVKAALEGAKTLRIQGRDVEKCAALRALALRANPEIPVEIGDFTGNALRSAAARSDLLINATPLGMEGFGADFASLDFLSELPQDAFVCDLVYTPARTKLLQEAERLGLETLNGLGMLLYQAILSQEYFAGGPLNRKELYKVLREEMQNGSRRMAV